MHYNYYAPLNATKNSKAKNFRKQIEQRECSLTTQSNPIQRCLKMSQKQIQVRKQEREQKRQKIYRWSSSCDPMTGAPRLMIKLAQICWQAELRSGGRLSSGG